LPSTLANDQMRSFLKESHTVLGTDNVGDIKSVNASTFTGG